MRPVFDRTPWRYQEPDAKDFPIGSMCHPVALITMFFGDVAEVSGERVRVKRAAATDSELSWTRGVLELHDAPLSTVAQELRRWYGVKLVVTDSTIASRRLTATFERATADEIGRVLAAVLGGSVTRSGDTLRLGAAGAR